MSVLSEAVVTRLLEKTDLEVSVDDVERILGNYNVPTSATKASPVPLRVARIRFSGTKQLPMTHPDAVSQGPAVTTADVAEHKPDELFALEGDHGADGEGIDDPETRAGELKPSTVPVPFEFDWQPRVGVNGIGSSRNLRGKSSILNVIMWALTGRCANFQPDIQKWIERVAVDWDVGSDRLRVRFDASNGHPVGVVETVEATGTEELVREIGRFDGAEQFEGVMGSVMMGRLRLEQIPVWTVDREVRHAWPAYSSALTVRADKLDPVVGNETTIGIRMLQMFVGTDWAPASAAAKTAVRAVITEQDAAVSRATAAGEVVREARSKARRDVDELTAKIAALPDGTPDTHKILEAASNATNLAREVHGLERRLMDESAAAATIKLQLRAAKARQHTLYEDARLTKFFHRMEPTVCPRCAAKVTDEQRAAEVDKHECSLCTRDLDLKITEPSKVDADDDHDDDGDDINGVEALEAALAAAEQAEANLQALIAQKTQERNAAEATSGAGDDLLAAARERRTLELALARAQGALEALTKQADPKAADPIEPTISTTLSVADDLLSEWVRVGQSSLLGDLSADIERLAVSFGADSLSNIKLGGNGRMDVDKGGEPVTYTKLTPGEKLRVKIATAIALIKHGYVAGIGRHPGLLVLDSPAAEEMPEEDLATMIQALKRVTAEADMQVFVATRNAGPLVELLPETNRRVADGDAYMW